MTSTTRQSAGNLMRRTSLFRSITTIAATALATASCHDSTSPDLSPRLAAGTYVLETVTGRGPANGIFVLNSSGQAERRVRYTTPSIADNEYVAIGTFQLL